MIDPKRIEQVPIIREHACQLRMLAKEIVSSRRGPYKMNDFLGAMTDAFMHKQIAHLKSICILVDAGQTPDALIIARTAYENMILLLWATDCPGENYRESRSLKWFAYEFIEGYRKILACESNSVDIDPKVKTAILQGVKEYGEIFLTKKAKDGLCQRKSLSSDPFIKGWPKNLRDMTEELKENGKIDQTAYQLYQTLSQWPHGTPQGMGMIFHHDGDCFSCDEDTCKYLGGCAIVVGIESLGRSSILFNNHFELNFQDRLADLGKKFSEL